MIRFRRDWRDMSRVIGKMDDDQKGTALLTFSQCGQKTTAATAAGVSPSTLTHHLEEDPDFACSFEEALDFYRDEILAVVSDRALNGVLEPVIGGKNKDEVVAHIRRFETQLTMMHAKRYIPEFSERYQVEVSGSIDHGVLLVGSGSNSAGSGNGSVGWADKYSGKIPPGSLDLPMAPALAGVEVEPTAFEKDPQTLGWESHNDRRKQKRKAEGDSGEVEVHGPVWDGTDSGGTSGAGEGSDTDG